MDDPIIETDPLICSADQLTGLYMIGTSVMKELILQMSGVNLKVIHVSTKFQLLAAGLCRYSPVQLIGIKYFVL